jgi:hypothetical protein
MCTFRWSHPPNKIKARDSCRMDLTWFMAIVIIWQPLGKLWSDWSHTDKELDVELRCFLFFSSFFQLITFYVASFICSLSIVSCSFEREWWVTAFAFGLIAVQSQLTKFEQQTQQRTNLLKTGFFRLYIITKHFLFFGNGHLKNYRFNLRIRRIVCHLVCYFCNTSVLEIWPCETVPGHIEHPV